MSPSVPPVRSVEQCMNALAAANVVRSARAVLRKKIAAGHMSIYDVIVDVPEEVAGVPIVKILSWAPRIGHVKAQRLLTGAEIPNPNKALGTMTERHKKNLIATMRNGTTGVGVVEDYVAA